ncbi:MAG: rubredoxin-like domain-containing protein [Bacillota bacterium]
MKIWRCEVCGYLHEGEEPPEFCPKCGVPRDRFVLLDEEEAQLMIDAGNTKEKYSAILKRLNEIHQLAQEGLDLDLDDGCNQIFTRTKAETEDIRKMIKNELAGHAGECIWVKVANDGEMP